MHARRTAKATASLLAMLAVVACSKDAPPAPVAAPPATLATPPALGAAAATPATALAAVPMPEGVTAATALAPLRFKAPPAACAAETTTAARRALAFAATLDVDPERLQRDHGMYGYKHLTELLSLYRLIARWPGDAALSAQAKAQAHALLDRVAAAPGFHRLGEVDDATFAAESMSYLRGCWYAEELGWDTRAWRAAIVALQPRLDAHRESRGVDQRMSFAVLYGTLGLPNAERILDLYPQTAIATLRDFAHFVQRPENGYELTHEVFALTARGSARPPYRRPEEARYAERAAYTLLHVHLMEKGHDLVAELMLCRRWLGAPMDEQLSFARSWLRDGQNADGSFGFHTEVLLRRMKGNPRYDAKVGGYLHTTMIALWALMATCA